MSVLILFTFTACGGDSKDGGNPPSVSITISPTTASVATAQKQTFTASVTNTTNTTVTWSLQEGTTGGSITTAGEYTASTTAGTYHVIATSQADTSKKATATVTITAVSVTVTPSTVSLPQGNSQDFSASVTPTGVSGAVTWSVQEGTAGGSITNTGRYTAPNVNGTYHVVATSVADGTKTGTATVIVTAPAPDFAINSCTEASEGEPYHCTFALVNPDEGSLTFTLTSDSPAGATISENELSWTPTAEQSRKDNVFTVVGTATDDRIRRKSWTVAPSGTIHGEINEIHITPSGRTPVPVDLIQNPEYPTEIEVWSWDSDGNNLQVLTGTGHADGTFEVAKVPAGQYLLYVGTGDYRQFVTDRSSIDLSYTRMGRANPTTPTGATYRELKLTDLDPWDSSKHMMYWYLPNLDETRYGPEFGEIAQSSTSVNANFGVWSLADSSLGDFGFALQKASEEEGDFKYTYIVKATDPLSVNDVDGTTSTISAALKTPPSLSFRAKASLSEFATARPSANIQDTEFEVLAHPGTLSEGLADQWGLPEIAVLRSDDKDAIDDIDFGDLTVGNPYPTDWPPVYHFSQHFTFPVTAPGATAAVDSYGNDDQITDVKPTVTEPITPLIKPVSSGTIDGKNLFANQTNIPLTPLITWEPTVTGEDSAYELSINELCSADFNHGPCSAEGTESSYFGVGASNVVVNGTSIRVPAGILEPGKSYFVEITAIKETGIDLTSTPSLFGFPRAQSSSISGIFTTTSDVSPEMVAAISANKAVFQKQSELAKKAQLKRQQSRRLWKAAATTEKQK